MSLQKLFKRYIDGFTGGSRRSVTSARTDLSPSADDIARTIYGECYYPGGTKRARTKPYYAVVTVAGNAILRDWPQTKKLIDAMGKPIRYKRFDTEVEANAWIADTEKEVRFWKQQ